MLQRAVCLFAVGLLAAQSTPDPAAIARKALDCMLGGKYEELHQMFIPQGQKDNPAEGLAKIGTQLKALGAPGNIGTPSVTRPGPNFVVAIPVSFASQEMKFTIAVNAEGQVVAFLQQRGEVAWQRPPYSKPESFKELAVTVGYDWKLAGTLTVPAGSGPFPAVVLVHDSGPQDRDETVFGGTKPFRDLAEGLASRGIVVLRYEKRTRQYVVRMADKANRTAHDETEDDALKALAFVRTRPEVNQQKVFLLGHGLGGYLAPRIAQEDGKLAGVIILGGNARPLEDVLVDLEILHGMTGKDLDLLKLQAKRVKALDSGDSDAPPILGMPAAYILDLKGYDPAEVAKALTARLLIVQGERDFQVTAKDFNLWKSGLAARKDATFRSYPALNHLMVAGQGKSTEAEYRKPGHVAPELVDDIAKWVAQ